MEPAVDVELNSSPGTKEVEQVQVDEVIAPEASTSSSTGISEGYIQLLATVAFGFTLQASWEGVALTMQFSILNGGPASLVYGGILTALGAIVITLSLAEMASIDPVVGAQYRWSAKFAPAWPRFWGLLQGWLTILAWVTATAASPAYLAFGVQSLVSLWHPSYAYPAWQTTVLMIAFTFPPVIANLWFRKIINPMEAVGAAVHAIFFLASVVLLAVRGPRSSDSLVWNNLTTGVSGWTSPGVAFGIGLLPAAFSTAGMDGILHMSKEVKNARRNVPIAMTSAVAANSILQWVLMIVVCYRLGDPQKIANAPGGTSIIAVYMQATNSRAVTTVFIVAQLVVLFVSLFNIFASVARLTWAFSQNDGLPFSRFFAHVSPRYRIPIRALILVAVVCVLLSFINLGSTTAFNASLSLPTVGFYISYFFPIAFILIAKLRGRPIAYGPFRLGKAGIVINLVSLMYILYILSFVALPTMLPVTSSNMNYAGPIVLAVVIIALMDWCIGGRKRFVLPKSPTSR